MFYNFHVDTVQVFPLMDIVYNELLHSKTQILHITLHLITLPNITLICWLFSIRQIIYTLR